MVTPWDVVKMDKDSKPTLLVGASRVKITPEQDVPLAGTGFRRYSTGVNDDLWARTVVISNNVDTVVITSVDLWGIPYDDVRMLKSQINDMFGIPEDYIFICATHTHSAPDIIGFFGGTFDSYIRMKYIGMLREKIIESVLDALKNMKEAQGYVAVGRVENMTVNRRRKGGEVDNSLTVLQFSSDDENIATVINFASHPTITDAGTKISADFPGFLCNKVEEELGGVSIFLNGAQGDVEPLVQREGERAAIYGIAHEYGERLAECVVNILGSKTSLEEGRLRVYSGSLKIPLGNPNLKQMFTEGVVRRFTVRVRNFLGVETEVSIVDLSGVLAIMLPGEIFARTGLELKSKVQGNCIVVCPVNDMLGYFVPEDEYNERLYEENMCISKYAKTMITGAVLGLLSKVKGDKVG